MAPLSRKELEAALMGLANGAIYRSRLCGR